MNTLLVDQIIRTAREFPFAEDMEVENIAKLRYQRSMARRNTRPDPLDRPAERVFIDIDCWGKPVFGYESRLSGRLVHRPYAKAESQKLCLGIEYE